LAPLGSDLIEDVGIFLIPEMKVLKKRYWHDGTRGPRTLRAEYVVPRRDGSFPPLPHEESVIRFTPKKGFDVDRFREVLTKGGVDAFFIESFCKTYEQERYAYEWLAKQIKGDKKFGNKIFWRKWFDLLFVRCRGTSLLFLMAGKARKVESIKRREEFVGKDWSGAIISNKDAATLTEYVAEEVFGKCPYTYDSLVTKYIPEYRKDRG